jgi:hypothetical protein
MSIPSISRARLFAAAAGALIVGSLALTATASAAGLAPVSATKAVAKARPPINWKIADVPKGFVFKKTATAAEKARALAPFRAAAKKFGGPNHDSNPACSNCNPPLLFTPNAYVMGGYGNTPGDTTITPIFWTGKGYTFTGGYERVIDQYLHDVAAASNTANNVFSPAEEYYQQINGGPKQYLHYQVTANAQIVDTNAYPLPSQGGCPVASGYNRCVTDAEEQAQLKTLVTSDHLVVNSAHIYMVFFPSGVETCFSNSPGAACSSNVYCGYHSAFNYNGPLIYANMPYPNLNGCSDPWDGAQSPNGAPEADAMISIVSHEYNESITDWDGAWIDSQGNEDGDECAYVYGNPLGGSLAGGTAYNQIINGHHYFTQDEFSNNAFNAGVGDNNTSDGSGQQVVGCIQRGAGYGGVAPVATTSGVSPASGPTTGGTTITVTGNNFVAGDSVEIGQGNGLVGAVSPTKVTVVSATKLTAVTPAGKSGRWYVFVIDEGGYSPPNGSATFTYK